VLDTNTTLSGAYKTLPNRPQDLPLMPVQLTTIARNTFVEAIRQPIFFVVIALCGMFQFFNTWTAGFSLGYSDSAEVSGDNKMLLDIGLATVFGCGVLLAAFVATAVVSREIENKTVLTVVSKPVARPTVIVGKYIGVAGAMILAVIPMLLFLMMGLRHGVMSTAADTLDGPVWVFSFAAIGLSLAIALWCNFFYGWYFTQTAVLLLAPAMVVAYLFVLLIGKKWNWQPIGTNFKDQITFACVGLTLALLVLTAVATAVSTRLGQVMTIVVCGGVFLFGLLSNYLIGRHAFQNTRIGMVREANPADFTQENWAEPGATYNVQLITTPASQVRPGDSFYYSTSATGFPLTPSNGEPFSGAVDGSMMAPDTGGLVITAVTGPSLTVRRFGQRELEIPKAPESGDSVFIHKTTVRPIALGLWSVIPNMHYFWLVDAVSQNQPIPIRHMLLIAGYAVAQITAFLALGVVLFQKRDVG
jgi:ABC-2 type transport system permease protein